MTQFYSDPGEWRMSWQEGEIRKLTPRLYHLAIRRTDGRYVRLTGYPMTHPECVTMKTKFSTEQQSRILFVDAESEEA